jgi:hypothetical protein
MLPNIKTAVLLVTVVIDGKLVKLALEIVVHAVGVETSNGLLLLTPEKATIAPVAAVDDAVTPKVWLTGSLAPAIL